MAGEGIAAPAVGRGRGGGRGGELLRGPVLYPADDPRREREDPVTAFT